MHSAPAVIALAVVKELPSQSDLVWDDLNSGNLVFRVCGGELDVAEGELLVDMVGEREREVTWDRSC
jgi:hypothetical protein